MIRALKAFVPFPLDGLRGLQRIMKTQNPKIGEINTDNLVGANVVRKK